MAGVEIDSVHLALSGPHVKGFNSRGVIAVAGKNREITRDDVRRAIDAAKAVALPTGREILHVLPQDFVVDEQDGIGAPGRHDRRAARGQRARRHRRRVVDAEHRRVRQPRRRDGRGHRDRAAGGGRGGADARREGARRRARGHRRRHRRPGDLRARQPLAHRRRRRRRRSLHQRHRRRPAHADSRRGEGEAQERLRAVVDGGRGRHDRGRERRRPQAAADGAAHPVGDSAAARRGDLPSRVGRDPARRLREVAQLGNRAHRRRLDSRGDAGDRRADFRPADPARAARSASAGWRIT